MTLKQFRATMREIPCGNVAMPDHVNDLLIGQNEFASALIYDAETWIAKRHGGTFWLILERDEFNSPGLAQLEEMLFDWHKKAIEG